MLFNSIDFMIYFPVVVSVFFVIPKKLRYIWLLIASYYFYMSWNPKYALLMALSTTITWISGVLLEKCGERPEWEKYKRLCVAGSLISNLLILGVFKYGNFVLENIDMVASRLGFSTIDRRLDLLLPVGISFYTFQALSYTLDVYRGEIKAEKNILRYALFVSFFPQLVAGPIERSKNLLSQIQNVEKINVWNFEQVRDGFLLMMWGLFQKLVVADRAAILVEKVYDNYRHYGFVEITIATILFAFQIYCDFGGYSNIARGAAQVMGFELMKNFEQPYLATSIKEFWRRWHVSLTSWFTDYLYIPLGGNRKGLARKYLNILIVFGVSGMWHGASWNFIAWGLLHAIYQIVGDAKHRIFLRGRRNVGKTQNQSWSTRFRKEIGTFLLVDFAWIFFASDSFMTAIYTIRQMFTVFQAASIWSLGLNRGQWFFLLAGIVILMVVDVWHEQGKAVFEMVNRKELWFRWMLYLGLIWFTIMFGVYGIKYDTSQFIYFQF